ncbi:MAG: tyrosine-type recombinase/integrase [Ignavibacteriaceae bacterium]|nr:tyrosine-type recombinase/integrase [Ignavibacteriaceae bacterium]
MYLSKNKKSGIWYVYYRNEERKKTRLSTRTTFKNEALNFLKDFDKEKKKISNVNFTLNEFTIKYLGVSRITHTDNSQRMAKSILEKFKEFVGSDVLLKNINKNMAESFILSTYQRAKYNAALQLRHLKAAFNRAIEWGFIEKNPFKGIKLRIPENNPTFITKEELNTIVANEKDLMLKNIYLWAFHTGMRLSEIMNLEWSDLDLTQNIIRVRNKESFTTKSKRERIIPIGKVVLEILNGIKENPEYMNSNYIFNKAGERLGLVWVSKKFKKCVRLANLSESIHFHTLRHSFASHLVQRGTSLYILQKLLGHSQISITQKYSHLNQESMNQAILMLD